MGKSTVITARAMQILLFLVFHRTVSLGLASSVNEDEAKFRQVEGEFKKFTMRYYPRTFGHQEQNEVPQLSLQVMDDKTEEIKKLLNKLKTVDGDRILDHLERQNFLVLRAMLQTYISGAEWNRYGSLTPLSFMTEYPLRFLRITPPCPSEHELESYLKEFEYFSLELKQIKSLMEEAIKLGRTSYATSLGEFSIDVLPDPLNDTQVINAFMNLVMYDGMIEGSAQWNKSMYTITETVIPALQQFASFYTNVYKKSTRAHPGVGSLDNGQKYYQACLDFYIGTEGITAQQVHDMGLKEVERINAEMKQIIEQHGFKGSIKEFVEYLKTKKRSELYGRSENVLLDGYKRIIFDEINPKLDKILSNIPEDDSLRIEKSNVDGTSGSYSYPVFTVNLFNSEDRPTFLMKALSLHEANPGHHMQHLYSKSQKFPFYRDAFQGMSYYHGPARFPKFDSYKEGWGLYAESLGETMGIYNESALELFGRYSAEMQRACRLVVDPGIHALNMSRETAIEYLDNYTAMPYSQIVRDIDRYITYPGQAVAYKMGEKEIFRIRDIIKDMLGYRYKLQEFNEYFLRLGSMPFALVEEEMKRWARRTLSDREQSTVPQPQHGDVQQEDQRSTGALIKSSYIHIKSSLFYFILPLYIYS